MFYDEYQYWTNILENSSDAYMISFDSTVIACLMAKKDAYYAIELAHTVFFPEGGGQPGDRGALGDAIILNTIEEDGHIYHISNIPLTVGSLIHGEVDFSLRHRRMQLHSAEHLLCSLIHNQYGYDNVGFHMSDDNTVTFDVNGALSAKDMAFFEKKANAIIYENKRVLISYPKKEELPVLTFRSKLEFTDNVRLVTIEDYDVCACCAPHVASTGEIGLIRVLDHLPHRGGTRILMTAGISALEDYLLLDRQNSELMKLLSAKRTQTTDAVKVLTEKNFQLQGQINELKKRLAKTTIDATKEELKKRIISSDQSPLFILAQNMDDVALKELINECTASFLGLVVGLLPLDGADAGTRFRYLISKRADSVYEEALPSLAKRLNAAFGGRGGGSPQMIQGQLIGDPDSIKQFFYCTAK